MTVTRTKIDNKCPWIRVEDVKGCSENGKSVLLLIDGKYITTGYNEYNPITHLDQFTQNDTGHRIYGITHWMPLPKFPTPTSTSEIVKDVANNYMDNTLVNCNMEGSSGIKEEVSAWSVNGEIKPGEKIEVLIKLRCGSVTTAIYEKEDDSWTQLYLLRDGIDCYGDQEVTHWMYIPI